MTVGRIERDLGEMRIEKVEAKYSIARRLGDFKARRGDLVRAVDGD